VKLGDGSWPDTQMGPLNDLAQRDRVVELVEDAVAHGATVAAGGKVVDGPGFFYEPTVVTDLSDGVRLADEEQFGPVLPVIGHTDLDDAIAWPITPRSASVPRCGVRMVSAPPRSPGGSRPG
jgi:acyl-CoA reductase-like NAD-dependent aldehyde dehydrogenase